MQDGRQLYLLRRFYYIEHDVERGVYVMWTGFIDYQGNVHGLLKIDEKSESEVIYDAEQ